MNSLRFTVRFRTDIENERRAAEHLKSLKHGEQNRFLVGTVLSALGNEIAPSSESIRLIVREELALALSAVTVPAAVSSEQNHNVPPDTQTQDDMSVFDDLELFG